ncbi:hypothetical protein I79_008909 [Cricetulus griseus]|uniref:Uncharacterized protein n=1 Tax=Cricetulus griseus TaxID=10029 RepID=G3HEC8_CRIGR|nr:hypothetical protein I79_008909 [Cricetulus griseus]
MKTPSTYPAGQQQAGAIGCSIICQANFDPVFWQFVCICCADYHVPFYTGIGNLHGRKTRKSFAASVLVPLSAFQEKTQSINTC